jgi:hypothetical protein
MGFGGQVVGFGRPVERGDSRYLKAGQTRKSVILNSIQDPIL